MGATVPLGNIVGIGEDIFLVTVVPLQRDFHAGAVIALGIEVHDAVERRPILIQVFDKGSQAAIILINILFSTPLIGKRDTDTGVEKRQFTQSIRQYVVMKLDAGKGLGRRPKAHFAS